MKIIRKYRERELINFRHFRSLEDVMGHLKKGNPKLRVKISHDPIGITLYIK